MSPLEGASVVPFGECAVVLEYGDRIDPAVHERVLGADRAITAADVAGVEELVPSYRSLLVRIDPLATSPEEVVDAIAHLDDVPAVAGGSLVDVEVSFAPDDAPDLPTVADRTGLHRDEVVGLLTGTPLRVYLHGFAPGFAYLGGVPGQLDLARRATPRAPVPPGSVLLAAGQAALCPTSMPTGWWVVGRTDHVLFDPRQDPVVPFGPGDEVRLVVGP